MTTSAFPNPVGTPATDLHGHQPPSVFYIRVNGRDAQLADPCPSGREILSTAGFEPPDEHVLIQMLPHGTKSIGLDEDVELYGPAQKVFQAFRSDRLYLFTLDGHGYEWGASAITEKELRALASVPHDQVIVLERSDAGARVLTDSDELNLAGAGTEHLRNETRLVRVFLNDTEKFIPRGPHTTEELLKLLGVTPGYLLNVQEHGQLKPLQPGQTIYVKEGMKFYSQAPGGGSS